MAGNYAVAASKPSDLCKLIDPCFLKRLQKPKQIQATSCFFDGVQRNAGHPQNFFIANAQHQSAVRGDFVQSTRNSKDVSETEGQSIES